MTQADDWFAQRALVLHELQRLNENLRAMDDRIRNDHILVLEEIAEVKAEISALKVKSGFYGAIAGLGAGLALFAAQIYGGH